MRFDGKVLFATGGGSGLAEATARRFAAEGGRVAVADLDGARAEEVAGELGGVGVACDVADEASVQAAVERAHGELGSIDCVFNAAGHADFGPIEDWTLERFNRMIGVHLGGTFLVVKHVVPLMRAGERRRRSSTSPRSRRSPRSRTTRPTAPRRRGSRASRGSSPASSGRRSASTASPPAGSRQG